MTLRSITIPDWGPIERIQADSYPPEVLESKVGLKSHWSVSPTTCFVAELDGEVIGYILAHPWPRRMIPPVNRLYSDLPSDSDSLFIHDLALQAKARGQGVAGKLVHAVLEAGAELGLTHFSLISVQGTKPFWSRFGFTAIDVVQPDYADAVRQFYPGLDFFCMEMEAPQLVSSAGS